MHIIILVIHWHLKYLSTCRSNYLDDLYEFVEKVIATIRSNELLEILSLNLNCSKIFSNELKFNFVGIIFYFKNNIHQIQNKKY